MAIRGKDRRNAVLEKLLRLLWVGDVPGATSYLSSLDASDLKNKKWRDELIGYFQKKGSSITCYALRAKLGLRNSSNPVEKANDLIVAQHQNFSANFFQLITVLSNPLCNIQKVGVSNNL